MDEQWLDEQEDEMPAAPKHAAKESRSEERRVGKEC